MSQAAVERLLGEPSSIKSEAGFDGRSWSLDERWVYGEHFDASTRHPLFIHFSHRPDKTNLVGVWFWDHPFPPRQTDSLIH
jgi:hypothetical protein